MISGKSVICVSNTSDALSPEASKTPGARKIVSPSAYLRAIDLAGGVPLLTSECCVSEMAELCDGLLLTGGEDINPALMNEKPLNSSVKWDDIRDDFEMRLFSAFMEKGKPVFGICRGSQVINVAMGGSLYQDLVEQLGYVHMNAEIRHGVRAEKGSLLERLFGESFNVNSTHHQAVKDLAPGLVCTARSVEGIVEGFEHQSLPVFATQFHPERLTNIMWDSRTPDFAPLFKYFVDLCALRAAEKGSEA